jgi:hypothetical protein
VIKTTFAAIALTLGLASPALAADAHMSFTHEGVSYDFTVSKAGKSTIYRGNATPGGDFYLVERNNKVTGTANGVSVSFPVPKADKVNTAVVASK